MGFTERRKLVRRIEEIRGSTVICYLTSLRPDIDAMISDDHVDVFFDYLLKIPSRKAPRLDIFLCSNGGSVTVPWRLIPACREFADRIGVLVPYRAYSAATQLALGADEIVMHPFGELGPIDPAVCNQFNPTDSAGRPKPINVEDVVSFVDFVKQTVGITHEDELIRAIELLIKEANPLALGNVARFISQSRMIAKKILRTHIEPADEHQISEIVENLTAKLYFHAHPIRRREAQDELKLKVVNAEPPELESLMWELYKDFELEFENLVPFLPQCDLAARKHELDQQAASLAGKAKHQTQDGLEAISRSDEIACLKLILEKDRTRLAEALQGDDPQKIESTLDTVRRHQQALAQAVLEHTKLRVEWLEAKRQEQLAFRKPLETIEKNYTLVYTIIESSGRSSRCTSERRYSLIPDPQNPLETRTTGNVLGLTWEHRDP